MNAQVLIDSVVRQITVLIAQLATSGGIRAPVAHLANQVFVELARELESQGVSRKVSADMFGMALRAYIRKVRRLSEGQTERGRTLWQALLDFIRQEKMVSRARVLSRFSRDDELSLSSVLHDLTESGLVFASGSGDRSVFRAASESELGELSLLSGEEGLDELLWVIIYREGPLGDGALAERLSRPADQLQLALRRLLGDGRVQRSGNEYTASSFVVPLGSPVGWEAAVFDHLQAVVQTICQRLSRMSGPGAAASSPKGNGAGDTPIGGSTYSFDIWPGHPLEAEVKGQLDAIRSRCGELRCRVDAHNAEHGLTGEYQQIITYVGQCRLDKEIELSGDATASISDAAAHPGEGDDEDHS